MVLSSYNRVLLISIALVGSGDPSNGVFLSTSKHTSSFSTQKGDHIHTELTSEERTINGSDDTRIKMYTVDGQGEVTTDECHSGHCTHTRKPIESGARRLPHNKDA